ncbi:MAG TPA: EF-hand domain-containing protein [Sphingomicrobium sp.]
MRIMLPTIVMLATSGCMAALGTAVNAQGTGRDPTELLARSDTNRDGRITRAEYADSRARMFERLDRNRDGTINQADAGGRRLARRSGGGERLKQLAEFMDTNNDGRVTRAEFVDGPSPMFDRADANGDNIVSGSELEAFRAAARNRSR